AIAQGIWTPCGAVSGHGGWGRRRGGRASVVVPWGTRGTAMRGAPGLLLRSTARWLVAPAGRTRPLPAKAGQRVKLHQLIAGLGSPGQDARRLAPGAWAEGRHAALSWATIEPVQGHLR